MSEPQKLKEYKQGDEVHLTVELRDENGVATAEAFAYLEEEPESDFSDHKLRLSWFTEDDPLHVKAVLRGKVSYQVPGMYVCHQIVAENAYEALSRHELDAPLRFRIVEHPDDVRQGPEVLSVGDFR